MRQIAAKPTILKQVNLAHIRKELAHRETATRGELAQATGISSTTVRALLEEMVEQGEVEPLGCDASSGGRKARRYALRCDRVFGVAFCAMKERVDALLVNLRGEIVEQTELTVPGGVYEPAILAFLDKLVKTRDIRMIGLGLPGIVEEGGYWQMDSLGEELCWVEIGDRLRERYAVPVVLENDINATTVGCGRCYVHTFPEECAEDVNLAYLHVEDGCISAGFLSGGHLVRGYRRFAGELGLVPVAEGVTLDSMVRRQTDAAGRNRWMVQALCWVCAVLNPEYIALGGPALDRESISTLGDQLFSLLPDNMYAQLLYAPDLWDDYRRGMAHLTVAGIWDSVRLVSPNL